MKSQAIDVAICAVRKLLLSGKDKIPALIASTDMSFLWPVEAGDMVEFQAAVCYTMPEDKKMVVSVRCQDKEGQALSNTFYFMFQSICPDTEVPFVAAANEDEANTYFLKRKPAGPPKKDFFADEVMPILNAD